MKFEILSSRFIGAFWKRFVFSTWVFIDLWVSLLNSIDITASYPTTTTFEACLLTLLE